MPRAVRAQKAFGQHTPICYTVKNPMSERQYAKVYILKNSMSERQYATLSKIR
jgi:hypothetical protein